MPIRIGPTELVLILVIVMIIFGVGKLPQVGSALGRAIREFRQAQSLDEPSPNPSSEPSEATSNGRGAS